MADTYGPSSGRIRLRYYIVPLVVLWTLILISLMAWETASELFPFTTQAVTFFVIWLLGAIGIIFGGANLRWRMRQQEQARQLLIASEKRFEQLFVEAPIAYHSLDNDGRILDVNTAWQELLGRKKEEVISTAFSDYIVQKYAKAFEEELPCLKANGQTRNLQFEMVRSDGKTIAVSLNGNIARDASGNFVRTHCTLVNITEIWKSQEAVRLKNEELDALNEELMAANEELTVAHDEVVESQEALEQLAARNKAILAAVPDIIMEVDNSRMYTWANRTGLAFFGDDVLGKEAEYYFEGEQETYGKVSPLFEGQDDTFYVESWQRRQDGEKRLLAWWCKPIKDKAGLVTGALSTARDITEHEKAERALRESQELLNATLESTADGILVVDTGGQTVLSNQRFQDMWHIPPELMESRDDEKQLAFVLDQLVEPGTFLAKVRELYGSTLESFDTLCFNDGRVFERYSCPLIREGNATGRVWSFRDVSKRMQAEEALKFSEEKFAKSFQYGPFFMIISSIEDGALIDVNDKFVEATGYSREEAIGKTSIELGLLTPEDREAMKQQLLTQGRIKDLEVIIGEGIPRTFHARLNGEVITVAGQPRLFIIVEDITERKLTEEELYRLNHKLATTNDELIGVNEKLEAQYKELSATHDQLVEMQHGLAESEARYRTLMEQSQVPIVASSSDRLVFVNHAMCNMLGYDHPDEIIGREIGSDIHLDDRQMVLDSIQSMLSGKPMVNISETRMLHKDGSVIWAEVGASVTEFEGQLAVVATLYDITARRQAQQNAERLLKHQATVNKLALALSDLTDLDHIYSTIYEHISSLMDTTALVVSQYESEEDVIRINHVTFEGKVLDVSGFPLLSLGHVQGKVIHTGQPLYLPDYQQAVAMADVAFTLGKDGQVLEGPPDSESNEPPTNSAIFVPLQVENVVTGVLQVQSMLLDAYTQADIDLLATMGNVAAIALRNANNYAQAQQEILERKQAEEALSQSEQRYRSLAENLPCIVYRAQLGDGGSMQFFNNMLDELTGYEPEELQQEGKYAINIGIIPEDRPAVAAAVKRSIEENVPFTIEYRYKRKDGGQRWFAEDGRPVYGTDNQPLYIDGVIFDITERKQAEEALRESEEDLADANQMLRLVLDTIPVRVFWKDRESRYLGCNWLFAQDAGLDEPEDLLGKDDYDLGWHDQAEMYRADDYEVMTTGESKLSYEEPQTTPIGETIWLTTSKIPLRNSAGEILGVLGTYEDITARKQAEEALMESEERYRYLFETMGEGIVAVDATESVSFAMANPAAERLFGVGPGELIGQQLTNFCDSENAKIIQDQLAIRSSGQAATYELELTRADGESRYVQVTANPRYNDQGRFIGSLSLLLDVTKRKEAEVALRDSEERYRELFTNSPIGIYRVSPDGCFLLANQSLAMMLGYSSAEKVAELNLEDMAMSSGCSRVEYKAVIERDGFIQGYESYLVKPDGTQVFLRENARVVLAEDSSVLYYEGTAEDITERKQLEAQLRQSQKLEAIGTLAGGIAHDFNNILQAILGYTAITIEDLPPGSTMRENLGEVIKASSRARDLVAQILAYARRTEEERRVVDFGLIAKEALKLLRATMLKSIEIRQDIHIGSTVLADPTQLHQVIMNLCTNAMHAMKDAGELSITLAPVELTYHDVARLGKISPGHYLELVVADSGPGIAPDVVERIFDPFFTTKEPGTGTGMGLAVVHGIVNSCDGAVTAENKPEGGAVFRVYLPITRVEPSAELSQPEALPTGSESIMLVDDEAPVLDLLEKIVKRLGYRVRSFNSSLAALAAFQAEPDAFDLVITDQVMPAKTGLELARQFVSIRPDLPVLLCTGHVGTILPRRVWERWIRMCVTKPFDQLEISLAIRQVLEVLPEAPSRTEQA